MVKVGIIGCGHISKKHLQIINEIDDAELTGVVDCDRKKAELVAHKYGGNVYLDYHEMINIENVEIVHICTPHYLHKEMAVYAMMHGAHVILEKPMALSNDDCNELIEVSYITRKSLAVVFQNRLNANVCFVKEQISTGRYGEVLGIDGAIYWSRDEAYYHDSPWRASKELAGGGVIINQAIHTIDLLRYFGGEIKRIRCKMDKMFYLENEVEDTAHVYMEYKSGAKGILFVTVNSSYNRPVQIDILCERKKITLIGEDLYIDKEKVDLCSNEANNVKHIKNRDICYGNGHRTFIMQFYSNYTDFDYYYNLLLDIKETMNLIFNIYKSDKEKKDIMCDNSFFKNSIYINKQVQNKISNELSKLFDYIVELFKKNEIKANVYVSGSLARQEPTMRVENQQAFLNSDIDFVIIYQDEEERNTIKKLLDKVKSKFSMFQNSFVLITKQQALNCNSFFRRDLLLGFKHPIYVSIDIDMDTGWKIGRKHYIESIVTQACGALLNPDLTEDKSYNEYFKDYNYHWMKLIMECLRSCCSMKYDVNGYNDIIKKGLYPMVSEVMSQQEVELCVKAREFSDHSLLPDVDLQKLFEYTCCKLLGCQNLEEKLIELLKEEKDEILRFQYTYILFCEAYWKRTENSLILLKDAVQGLRFCEDCHEEMKQKIHLYLENKVGFTKIVLCMRKIRNYYVVMLHKRNTAENIFTDKEK